MGDGEGGAREKGREAGGPGKEKALILAGSMSGKESPDWAREARWKRPGAGLVYVDEGVAKISIDLVTRYLALSSSAGENK